LLLADYATIILMHQGGSIFRKTFFVLGSIASFLPFVASAAFGVSPPFLNADHLVAGARYTQTIYLVRNDAEEELSISAKLDIPEKVRPWITIDKGFDFVMPKGVRQFPVEITVQIPKNETRGFYSGNMVFTGGAPKTGGQVSISLAAQVAINLTIGTDIFRKFSVPVIRPLDIEEGWNPRIYVKFNNEGNVPERFDAATLEILDKYGGTRLAYVQKAKDFPETPPFTIKEYSIEFPIDFHLGLGQYWAGVAFYQNEKIVATQKTPFNVLKAGSLSNPAVLLLNHIKANWIYYLIAVLAFAAAVLILRRKRAKR